MIPHYVKIMKNSCLTAFVAATLISLAYHSEAHCLSSELMKSHDCGELQSAQPCFCSQLACQNGSFPTLKFKCSHGFAYYTNESCESCLGCARNWLDKCGTDHGPCKPMLKCSKMSQICVKNLQSGDSALVNLPTVFDMHQIHHICAGGAALDGNHKRAKRDVGKSQKRRTRRVARKKQRKLVNSLLPPSYKQIKDTELLNKLDFDYNLYPEMTRQEIHREHRSSSSKKHQKKTFHSSKKEELHRSVHHHHSSRKQNEQKEKSNHYLNEIPEFVQFHVPKGAFDVVDAYGDAAAQPVEIQEFSKETDFIGHGDKVDIPELPIVSVTPKEDQRIIPGNLKPLVIPDNELFPGNNSHNGRFPSSYFSLYAPIVRIFSAGYRHFPHGEFQAIPGAPEGVMGVSPADIEQVGKSESTTIDAKTVEEETKSPEIQSLDSLELNGDQEMIPDEEGNQMHTETPSNFAAKGRIIQIYPDLDSAMHSLNNDGIPVEIYSGTIEKDSSHELSIHL